MDFFEAQERARKKTWKLVALYMIAVILMIMAIYIVVFAILGYMGGAPQGASFFERVWHPSLFLFVTVLVLMVLGTGTLFRISQLRKGGAAVAQMLGGRKVDPSSTHPAEQRLINVVEEMSIAAGLPVPDIYVLDNEASINAFAAGYGTNDAAVGVTRGCLEQLTRDELQGVIAHEFSHVFNGDMRLNIRLIGILNGILLLHLTGMIVMRSGAYANIGRGSSGRGQGGNAVPVILIGLSLMVIGYIGMLFGRIIQSAVSRQREYLADAAAVQYTRNPEGLAGALKKIAAAAEGSIISDGHSMELSHLFFANSFKSALNNIFATHPPIKQRIKAILPSGDADALRLKKRIERQLEREHITRNTAAQAVDGAQNQILPGLKPEILIALAGTIDAEQLNRAEELLKQIPPSLKTAVHNPLAAEAVVYGLLLTGQGEEADAEITIPEWFVHESGAGIVEQLAGLLPELKKCPREYYLPLVDMAMPALRQLSPEQYQAFRKTIERLAGEDNRISLFEFALEKIVIHRLDDVFSPRKERPIKHHHFKTLSSEIEVLLSALAHAAGKDSEKSWQAGLQAMGKSAPDIKLLSAEQCGVEKIDQALSEMAVSANPVKKLFLTAALYCIGADRVVSADEMELLRAIAEALETPIPRMNRV